MISVLVRYTHWQSLILLFPQILMAISPLTAFSFFKAEPFLAFLSLSLEILYATGTEALFADMGHIGIY